VSIDAFDQIQVKLRSDNAANIHQWFYFRLQGAAYQPCHIHFLNAGEATYPQGWANYQAFASYDRVHWFRVKTSFDGTVLHIIHTPLSGSVYYAYFEPYSYEQHLHLIGHAQSSGLCHVRDIGSSVQGRDLNLLTIGNEADSDLKIWISARQHPGETMSEWFIEGLLDKLLDPQDSISRALLDRATFYVLPNMNPDGAVLGNLRTNAAGVNLNRAWLAPSMETSPEVYLVRETMQAIGVDCYIDVHGDESIPYVFLMGTEGLPSQSRRVAQLEKDFTTQFKLAAPDMQDKHGYETKAPGTADLSMATNWVGHHFDCLSLTLEMPFKDNDNWPDDDYGWNGSRSKCLGSAILYPLYGVLDGLRQDDI
jgi:murein tripeptide amidase MpaA